MDSKLLLDNIVDYLEGKKARDISVIDIKGISILADYFVVCTGTSNTHIQALADEVELKTGELGLVCLHKEGYDSARWILLDLGDVIVHIFSDADRNLYNLERLWSDGILSHRG